MPQESPETRAEDPVAVHTGVGAVDEVIAAVDRLADAPIDEHAQVFGTAHEALRRALDVDQDA